MEMVKLLPVYRYSADIFSYSGPSGILGSDGKQNTSWCLGTYELLHFPLVLMIRLDKTVSDVFNYCRFDLLLKTRFTDYL